MMRPLALVLTLSGLYACVPDSQEGVAAQNTKVTLLGTFSSEGGTTDIYFGNSKTPIATAKEKGSFRIEVPRALIESSSDRRLYLYSSQGEEGISSEITEFESGNKVLGTIYLRPTVSVEGDILSTENGTPSKVRGAEIKIGRAIATSDDNGRYTIKVPQKSKLEVEVQKQGFVITKAKWLTGDFAETRSFNLYKTIAPEGYLKVPAQIRIEGVNGTKVPLYVDSSPGAEWIRVSATPFSVDPALDSTWQSLKDVITVMESELSQGLLYYQFADKDRSVVSGILSTSQNP